MRENSSRIFRQGFKGIFIQVVHTAGLRHITQTNDGDAQAFSIDGIEDITCIMAAAIIHAIRQDQDGLATGILLHDFRSLNEGIIHGGVIFRPQVFDCRKKRSMVTGNGLHILHLRVECHQPCLVFRTHLFDKGTGGVLCTCQFIGIIHTAGYIHDQQYGQGADFPCPADLPGLHHLSILQNADVLRIHTHRLTI